MTECIETYVTMPDGLQQLQRRWPAQGEAKAEVILVHGFTEHSGRYARFAGELSAAHYNVTSFDLRGHGKSQGAACFVRRFEQYRLDLDAVIEQIRKQSGGRPIYLFGHSLGGLIAATWCVTREPTPAGLILSAPAIAIRSDLFPWLRRAADIASLLAPRLRLVRMGGRYISRDPKVVHAFQTDPLVFHDRFPARTGAEILRAARQMRKACEMIRLPLLILHGTGDRVTDPVASEDLHQRAESPDKTLRLYPGLYHEVLNEPERADVVADVLQWLAERTK